MDWISLFFKKLADILWKSEANIVPFMAHTDFSSNWGSMSNDPVIFSLSLSLVYRLKKTDLQ